MPIIVKCFRCDKNFEIQDEELNESFISCPYCNITAPTENFSVSLFCPQCHEELTMPFDAMKKALQCPCCDHVFHSNISFSLSDDEDDLEILNNQSDAPVYKEGDIFDKYRIIRLLGKGGMGEVYLADHMLLNKTIAIKIMNKEFSSQNSVYGKRFVREAKLANRIESPNFVAVHDVGMEHASGALFIAMEYVSGKNLSEIMKKNGTFSEQEILQIALKVSEVLIILQKEKIVHRDIKPSNIMITDDGVVKLADLGIAKSENSEQNELTLTQGSMVFGTPNYASPEQCRSSHEVDFRSDIYSLGATMFHLAAGCPPYSGNTAMDTVLKVLNEPHKNLEELTNGFSSGFISLINDMLQRDPALRPAGADVLKMRIERLLAGRKSLVEILKEKVTSLQKQKVCKNDKKSKSSPKKKKSKKKKKSISLIQFLSFKKLCILIAVIAAGIYFASKHKYWLINFFNISKKEIVKNISDTADNGSAEDNGYEDNENDLNSKSESVPQTQKMLSESDSENPAAVEDSLRASLQARLDKCNEELYELQSAAKSDSNRSWHNRRLKFYRTLQKNLRSQIQNRIDAFNLMQKKNRFDDNNTRIIQNMVSEYSEKSIHDMSDAQEKLFSQQLLYYLKNDKTDPNLSVTDAAHPEFSGPLLRWVEHADMLMKKEIEEELIQHHVSADCIKNNCSIELCKYGVLSLDGMLFEFIRKKKYGDAATLIYYGANVNECDANGLTPLFAAIQHNNFNLVQLLLIAGADVNFAEKKSGQTPLFYAAKYGSSKIYNLLLNNDADENVTDKNNKKAKDYFYAKDFYMYLGMNDLKEVEKMLSEHKSLSNMELPYGQTPLQYACSHNAEDIVKLLLDFGADPNAAGSSLTVYPLAIAYDYFDKSTRKADAGAGINIFNMLLEKGADCRVPAHNGQYPDLLAYTLANLGHVDDWHMEYVKILLEKYKVEDLNKVFYSLFGQTTDFYGDVVEEREVRERIFAIAVKRLQELSAEQKTVLFHDLAWTSKMSEDDIIKLLIAGAEPEKYGTAGKNALFNLFEYAEKSSVTSESDISEMIQRAKFLIKQGCQKNISVNDKSIYDLKVPVELRDTLL